MDRGVVGLYVVVGFDVSAVEFSVYTDIVIPWRIACANMFVPKSQGGDIHDSSSESGLALCTYEALQ